MDPKFQAILNDLPAKQPRSRLEPYLELILEMRKRGRSYREITQVLKQSCGLRVGTSTINDFVLARSKSTKKRPTAATRELVGDEKQSKTLISTYKTHKNLQGTGSTQKVLEDVRRKPSRLRKNERRELGSLQSP